MADLFQTVLVWSTNEAYGHIHSDRSKIAKCLKIKILSFLIMSTITTTVFHKVDQLSLKLFTASVTLAYTDRHIDTHRHTHIHTQTHTNIHIRTHILIKTYANMHVRTHTQTESIVSD